jgi:hypothetical protein
LDTFVNDGTTVTLKGLTVKVSAGDAYRYSVQNGTLVLDNNGALTNDTTAGTGLNTSYFFLGAATNIFSTDANLIVPAPGVLVTNNNSYNAAIYLGDANNAGGGLFTMSNLFLNYVSDGDVNLHEQRRVHDRRAEHERDQHLFQPDHSWARRPTAARA